jgi:hypothetical protein
LREIIARLENVEKQNRNLKRGGMVAALLVAMMFVMGQARSNKTIEAEEFVLKGADGKMWAALQLNEVEPTEIGGAKLPGGPAPSLVFYGSKGETRALLGATPSFSRLLLYDFAETPRVTLGNLGRNLPTLQLDSDGGNTAQLLVSQDGPYLNMVDKEGFESTVGSSSNVTVKTGETHRRSAASVVLIGKDKKVLWSAP